MYLERWKDEGGRRSGWVVVDYELTFVRRPQTHLNDDSGVGKTSGSENMKRLLYHGMCIRIRSEAQMSQRSSAAENRGSNLTKPPALRSLVGTEGDTAS